MENDNMIIQNAKIKSQNHSAKAKNDLRFRCYHYSIEIIKFLKTLPNDKVYWSISDQLLRSATSIGANVVEAKSASSRRDFIKFYEIALKSANETKYWLALMRDGLNLLASQISPLLVEVEELANILASSLLTLKNKR